MITICTCCRQNSAGMHEWDCPMNPNHIVKSEITTTYCAMCVEKEQRILTLQSQVDAFKLQIDCAKTPLMADVIRERDELKGKVEEAREIIRLFGSSLLVQSKTDYRAAIERAEKWLEGK